MDIAQRVPFHHNQCPQCQYYFEDIQRCRAFAIDSWPKSIMAVFEGESTQPCPHYNIIRPGDTALLENSSSIASIKNNPPAPNQAPGTPLPGGIGAMEHDQIIPVPTSFQETFSSHTISPGSKSFQQDNSIESKQESSKTCPICKTTLLIRERSCPNCAARFSVVLKGYCQSCETVVQVGGNGRCHRCGGVINDARFESRLLEIPPGAASLSDLTHKVPTPKENTVSKSSNTEPNGVSEFINQGNTAQPARQAVPAENTHTTTTSLPFSGVTTSLSAKSSVKTPPGNHADEALIFCQTCKSPNPTNAIKCQNCKVNLLPAESGLKRLGMILAGLLGGALAGGLAYGKIQYEDLFSICPSPLYLIGAALFIPFFGMVMAFRRTPVYARYENRAKRHLELSPLQAAADFGQAISLAPENEAAGLLKQRSLVFEKLGMEKDALRDRLAFIGSPGAMKDEALVVKMFGGDSDTYISSRKEGLQTDLIKSGKAKAVGYCRKCKQAVELNTDLRCPAHRRKAEWIKLVLPEEIEIGKQAILQGMHKESQGKLKKLLTNIFAIILAAMALYYAYTVISR